MQTNPAGARDHRLDDLKVWLAGLPRRLGVQARSLRPASSDASFRRYFRIDVLAGEAGVDSYVVMDAPPEQEDCRAFVLVAELLGAQGVHTPQIVARDLERGFLLLSDLGTTTYSDALERPGVDVPALYGDALATLVRVQQAPAQGLLPPYDHGRLMAEMRLFPDWYVTRHLEAELTDDEREMLQASFEALVASAAAQPQVLVHRDYHCRNLMVIAAGVGKSRGRTGVPDLPFASRNPGVLDFQDAVIGPVTYDLVSLLRDAYVEWPESQQIDWAARYWDLARSAGMGLPATFDAFWQDLEWMGLQRSLKVLGIFARLSHRDGKDRYLADLPLVLRHTRRVVERYDAFSGLAHLLDRLDKRPRQTGVSF